MSNVLPLSAQVRAVAHFVEGCGLRSTSRLTGIARNTLSRLLVNVGRGCARLHDKLVRDVPASIIEADELYALIHTREKRKTSNDPDSWGDCYTFLAMSATDKLILSYRSGKRDAENTQEFMLDLRARVSGRPMLSTDGFGPYRFAVALAFGPDAIDYGVVTKEYELSVERQQLAANRYTPGRVKSVSRDAVYGNPDIDGINTSFVERVNLNIRMGNRRFTRLTNGHSKKYENHCASVDLLVCYLNWVRPHMTLRTTPAVAAGLATRPWTLAELVSAALAEVEGDEPDPTNDGQRGGDGDENQGATERDGASEVGLDVTALRGVLAVNDNGAGGAIDVRA